MNHDVREIAARFAIDGAFLEAVPHGNGHINDTYASRFRTAFGERRYVHQRINQYVFKEPEKLMENVARVTTHVGERVAAEGGDPLRECLSLVSTTDGKAYYRSSEGDYWRTYLFIEGAQSKEMAESLSQANEGGAVFGTFQRHLIKRAEREGFKPSVQTSPSHEEISSYADYYDTFSRQKKLPACNRKKLVALAEANALILTSIASPEGSVLSAHAYVADTSLRRTRLLYSASHFRDMSESADRNLVGRANRLLHWFEIVSFKNLGYLEYDLGGLPLNDSNPVLNAIAQFKLEFGGRQVIEYTGLVPANQFGKLLLSVKRKTQ